MGIYLTKKNTTTNKVEKFKVAGNSGYSHPVGSIYMSTENTSPASMFGGTWEQILGKFLLSSDDVLTYDDAGNGTITTAGTYHAGATGGEATHTLTVNEMPRHQHNVYTGGTAGSGSSPSLNTNRINVTSYDWFTVSEIAGGSQAHNNMPPYLAVYCWKRIG